MCADVMKMAFSCRFEGSLVDKDLFIFYCLHMLW